MTRTAKKVREKKQDHQNHESQKGRKNDEISELNDEKPGQKNAIKKRRREDSTNTTSRSRFYDAVMRRLDLCTRAKLRDSNFEQGSALRDKVCANIKREKKGIINIK